MLLSASGGMGACACGSTVPASVSRNGQACGALNDHCAAAVQALERDLPRPSRRGGLVLFEVGEIDGELAGRSLEPQAGYRPLAGRFALAQDQHQDHRHEDHDEDRERHERRS